SGRAGGDRRGSLPAASEASANTEGQVGDFAAAAVGGAQVFQRHEDVAVQPHVNTEAQGDIAVAAAAAAVGPLGGFHAGDADQAVRADRYCVRELGTQVAAVVTVNLDLATDAILVGECIIAEAQADAALGGECLLGV